MRVLVLVAAIFAVLAAPAWGQVPTPTPTPTVTPTPTPTPEELKQAELRKRRDVKDVRRDFARDGKLETCNHKRLALKRTLRSLTEQDEIDFPEFRPTLEAAIEDYAEELRRCEEEAEEAEKTPTPTPTPTPVPQTTPDPTPVPSTPAPESGDTPDFGGGGGGGSDEPPRRDPEPVPAPSEGDVAPVQPSPTPVPTPAAPVEPQLVVTRPDGDASLLLPALLLAAALLGLGLTGASALAARRGGRLAGWGHAWREAAYRTTGAWGDFTDWLRLGR